MMFVLCEVDVCGEGVCLDERSEESSDSDVVKSERELQPQLSVVIGYT